MSLFERRETPAFVGVIHLGALPGAPLGSDGLAAVEARALADARALAEGGVDGVILENLGDAPFAREAVAPWTVAAMTRIALRVRDLLPGAAMGINVLRNDAASALGIAAAVEAEFIRVNVHTGAMLTDQGWIEGRARHTLLSRHQLEADVRIAADVLVKHAVPPAPMDLVTVARDTVLRGRADALIVSGSGTGQPTDPARVVALHEALPEVAVWVGSGLTPESARSHGADVAIVGTWLHADSRLDRPVDVERVRTMAGALRG